MVNWSRGIVGRRRWTVWGILVKKLDWAVFWGRTQSSLRLGGW